jgi:hypothetical protein
VRPADEADHARILAQARGGQGTGGRGSAHGLRS